MKKCIYKDIDGICKHDGNISELKLTFLLVKYTEESETSTHPGIFKA